MADLSDLGVIVDTFPGNGDTGIPLLSNLSFTLSGLNYDEDSLIEGMFVEGPDTNLTIGPGLGTIGPTYDDNFLETPGLDGIVAGTVTVSGIEGNTVVTFDPTLPLGALTTYTVNLANILELDAETVVSGYQYYSFTTGSGSIQEVPSTVSTSILSTSASEIAQVLSGDYASPLQVVKMTPANHSAQNSPELDEIRIEFNKALDASSITASNVTVEALKATDHPGVSITNAGELAKTIEIDGNVLIIKI